MPKANESGGDAQGGTRDQKPRLFKKGRSGSWVIRVGRLMHFTRIKSITAGARAKMMISIFFGRLSVGATLQSAALLFEVAIGVVIGICISVPSAMV